MSNIIGRLMTMSAALPRFVDVNPAAHDLLLEVSGMPASMRRVYAGLEHDRLLAAMLRTTGARHGQRGAFADVVAVHGTAAALHRARADRSFRGLAESHLNWSMRTAGRQPSRNTRTLLISTMEPAVWVLASAALGAERLRPPPGAIGGPVDRQGQLDCLMLAHTEPGLGVRDLVMDLAGQDHSWAGLAAHPAWMAGAPQPAMRRNDVGVGVGNGMVVPTFGMVRPAPAAIDTAAEPAP